MRIRVCDFLLMNFRNVVSVSLNERYLWLLQWFCNNICCCYSGSVTIFAVGQWFRNDICCCYSGSVTIFAAVTVVP